MPIDLTSIRKTLNDVYRGLDYSAQVLQIFSAPSEDARGFTSLGVVLSGWTYDEDYGEFSIPEGCPLQAGGFTTPALLAQINSVVFNHERWILVRPDDRVIPETATREWTFKMKRAGGPI